MVKLAFISFFVAVVLGLLGFYGKVGAAATTAKYLFGLFLVLCVGLFVAAIFFHKSVF